MVSRFYSHHIASGKSILIFSVIIAVVIRLCCYMVLNPYVNVDVAYTKLHLIQSYIAPHAYITSVIISGILVFLIAFVVNQINTHFALIKNKSLLVPAFVILVFSSRPDIFILSPNFFGLLLFLWAFYVIFKSYDVNENKAMTAFKCGFILSLGTLFSPTLFFYIPLIWINLAVLRGLNFKSFLASIIGVLTFAVILCSVLFFFSSLSYLKEYISILFIHKLPLLYFKTYELIGHIFFIILYLICVIDNFVTRHRDSIQTRFSFIQINITVAYAILLSLLVFADRTIDEFIACTISSFMIAHFFVPAKKRWKEIVFYVFLASFLLLSFFNIFLSYSPQFRLNIF